MLRNKGNLFFFLNSIIRIVTLSRIYSLDRYHKNITRFTNDSVYHY